MRVQMQKWGNSLAVRIPRHIADEANLAEGDSIEIQVSAVGAVQLEKADKVPTLSQLVSQITLENRYEEIALGPEVGKESVEW
ncbi:MAG TPA: AbrB/MazE/SpoVT family DNA-binding domain-containing protein [Acidobacteriaceae bacterium]|nr:AbrB/MazE/SpoVT family DNA-binding domain-containing protein [Acidobacteriaceae bacterium]